MTTTVEQIATELADLRSNGRDAEADALKARYTRRMYNLSEFVKTLKQRFTMSYNRRHNRQGTLWESRFKSVLFEGSRRALWTLASYIDLNAVRAGIVSDPQDYRFCGYGEAIAGREDCPRRAYPRDAIARWQNGKLGTTRAKHYRHLLYQRGVKEPERNRGGIDTERVKEVLANGGRLTMREVLHCRVRYFSDGMILGSRVFVDETFHRYRSNFGVKRQTGARKMRNPHAESAIHGKAFTACPRDPADCVLTNRTAPP
jgi:putative transposase